MITLMAVATVMAFSFVLQYALFGMIITRNTDDHHGSAELPR